MSNNAEKIDSLTFSMENGDRKTFEQKYHEMLKQSGDDELKLPYDLELYSKGKWIIPDSNKM
jgi:hypothetical protein